MLDLTVGVMGTVLLVIRTFAAAAEHEAMCLVSGAYVLRPESARPTGTLGNLDQAIQKPASSW